MTFGEKVVAYYRSLLPPSNLPAEVKVLFPFSDPLIMELVAQFYQGFYNDNNSRTFLIGINPGRLGGGTTGIPFTDPVRLDAELNIANELPKKAELSSRFVYDVVRACGGAQAFYQGFYITSVCPVGFTKDAKNLNYYDLRSLQEQLEPYMVAELKKQVAFGSNPIAYSLGMGKNISYLNKLNKQHGFFETIEPLPHPRWVMQYRLKRKDEFIHLYKKKLMGTQ